MSDANLSVLIQSDKLWRTVDDIEPYKIKEEGVENQIASALEQGLAIDTKTE